MDDIVKKCAHGAATAMDCTVNFTKAFDDFADMVRVPALEDTVEELLHEMGRASEPVRLPNGSSDVGNVSYHCPAIQPLLTIGDTFYALHTPEFREETLKEPAHQAIADGGKLIGSLLLRTLTDQSFRERIYQSYLTQREKKLAPCPRKTDYLCEKGVLFMSSRNTLKKKKGIQLPHIYVLLFSVIIVCTILTWVLPAGEFDRVMNEATGRTVAVAGIFHTVEQSPVGIFQMFQSIYNGMCDAGFVTFFVFASFASINIIIASGAFNGLVAGLLKVFKGKARVTIIPIFMFIVGIASSTIGLFEEWFPFVPVFAGIAMAMDFDAVVRMAIVAFGAATGCSGAMMNPFTVGIAQGIAEVAPMSGTGYRFLCHMVLLEVGSALTIRYALKVQADPSKSMVYGETGHITMSEDDVQNSPFGIREKLVLLILLGVSRDTAVLAFQFGGGLSRGRRPIQQKAALGSAYAKLRAASLFVLFLLT